jgi:ATP-dependent Clp protease, protease subunit
MKKLPFNFNVVANADNSKPAEISIRGVIGRYFDPETYSMSDTEEDVLNELNQIPVGKKINVRINSPGGNVGLTLGCFNALARRSADITTFNEGYACSSASVLMLAGSRRVSPKSSLMMIHCASNDCIGNAADMRKNADTLDAHDKVMAALYAKAAGGTPEDWMKKMQDETWMTGEEAVANGLATSDDGEIQMDDGEPDAECKRIVATFKNIPENLRSRLAVRAQAVGNPPTPPTPQPQPKVKSMKKITAALVAAGLITASTEEQTEDSLLPQINAVLAENKRLKTENEGFVTARKNRVTAALDLAVTDKVIADTRKAGLLALGTATAEGENEVLAQLAELREAKAMKAPRGAAPVPRAQGGGEADTIESLLEEQAEAMKGTDGDLLASINAKLAEKRGRKDLFKAAEERRAYNN